MATSAASLVKSSSQEDLIAAASLVGKKPDAVTHALNALSQVIVQRGFFTKRVEAEPFYLLQERLHSYQTAKEADQPLLAIGIRNWTRLIFKQELIASASTATESASAASTNKTVAETFKGLVQQGGSKNVEAARKMIIEHELDVNEVSEKEFTIFMSACCSIDSFRPDPKMLRDLIKAGGNINSFPPSSQMMNVLIQAGVDTAISDGLQRKILWTFAAHPDEWRPVIKAIFTQRIFQQQSNSTALLSLAMTQDKPTILNELIDLGIPVKPFDLGALPYRGAPALVFNAVDDIRQWQWQRTENMNRQLQLAFELTESFLTTRNQEQAKIIKSYAQENATSAFWNCAPLLTVVQGYADLTLRDLNYESRQKNPGIWTIFHQMRAYCMENRVQKGITFNVVESPDPQFQGTGYYGAMEPKDH